MSNEVQGDGVLKTLRLVLSDVSGTHVKIAQIVKSLGARSFGIGILAFALPMIVPMPPGVPMTSGIIICIFSIQLVLGRRHVWLPNWVAEKQISLDAWEKAYAFAERYIGWVFQFARPRLPQLTRGIAKHIAGVLFFILGVLMILPIPFIGNILPAFACSILALGLCDHDGFIFVLGIMISVLAIGSTVMMGFGTLQFMEAVF